MPDAHNPPNQALFGNSRQHRFEHVFMGNPANGLGNNPPKGRPNRHHHLGMPTPLGRAIGVEPVDGQAQTVGDEVAGGFGLANIGDFVPAGATHAVARPRPIVVVGVVDGAFDHKVTVKNRGGLQVITGNPLPPHGQQVLGSLGKPPPRQGRHHIHHATVTRQKGIGGGQVWHDVTRRHVVTRMRHYRRLDFAIADGGEAQFGIHGLDGLGAGAANLGCLGFANRARAPIDLHVALQHGVIIQIIGIKIPPAKHVVAARYGTISRKNKVGAGDELQH